MNDGTRKNTEEHGCHPRRLTGTAVPTSARAASGPPSLAGLRGKATSAWLPFKGESLRAFPRSPAKDGAARSASPCRGGNSCACDNRLGFRVYPCFSVSHKRLAPQNRAQKTRCCSVVLRNGCVTGKTGARTSPAIARLLSCVLCISWFFHQRSRRRPDKLAKRAAGRGMERRNESCCAYGNSQDGTA